MDKGLDYNTQRPDLVLSEYGREIQKMVDHCIALPTKAERQRCAETIIATMNRMSPSQQTGNDRMQTLWDHLARISNFQLDIDYPVEITTEEQIAARPQPLSYPATRIPVRHYGKEMFLLFDRLKNMEPGNERDALTELVANQMKRCLVLWGHGNSDNEKVADDLARFTDGIIQLDLDHFQFEKIDVRPAQTGGSKKKKKK